MARTVGIVGAAGDVGRDLVTELRRTTGYRLVLADIREPEARALASTLGSGAEALRVDVNDPRSLAALCERCDLVVSTTGPSAMVRDKVASAALHRGLPYVDVGGSVDLYDALTDRDAQIRDRGLSYLVSAGFSPGATGTLPRYVMSRRFFDRVDSCQATLGLRERMSFVATHDMLSGLHRRKTPGYWSDGRWIEDHTPIRVSLPSPLGEVEAYRIVEAEIRGFVERECPGYFAMNTCVLGELQKLCYDFIVTLGLYRDPEQRKASAQFLSRIIDCELETKQPVLFLRIEAQGTRNGHPRTIRGTLGPRPQTSCAASCAAVYVRMLADGDIERTGRLWASEAADPVKFVAGLGDLGIPVDFADTNRSFPVEDRR